MDNLSDYALAQKQLDERQQKRNRFYLWVGILLFLLVANLLTVSEAVACLLPTTIGAILGVILSGLELYLIAPQHAPSAARVDQELFWLFGADWREQVGMREQTLAQERIRRRQIRRIEFVFHLLVFLAANGFIVYTYSDSVQYYFGRTVLSWLLALPVVWLPFLAYHAFTAFPTSNRLARRERKVGAALRRKMQSTWLEKLKHDDKPKRDRRYTVGDDGELVELDTESELFDEKPKRDLTE